jgi:hypothetical protein
MNTGRKQYWRKGTDDTAKFYKIHNSGWSAAPEAKHGCEATESVVHGRTPEFGRGRHPTRGLPVKSLRSITKICSVREVASVKFV